jgi:hypothetical protein
MPPRSQFRHSLLVSLLLTSACATVEPGTPAVVTDTPARPGEMAMTAAGLRVSSRQLSTLASPSFGVVEVTFANPSGQWVRMRKIGIDFGSPTRNQRVQIPWGTDLQSWHKATEQRNAIRDANSRTALEAIAIVGAVTAGVGAVTVGVGGARTAIVGGLLEVGAGGALVAQDIVRRADAAESVQPLPEDHLLSVPFSVPPGLFTKKWIVLNSRPQEPGGHDCIESATLSYETADGKKGEVVVSFGDHGSEWQSYACNYDPAQEKEMARARAALAARKPNGTGPTPAKTP